MRPFPIINLAVPSPLISHTGGFFSIHYRGGTSPGPPLWSPSLLAQCEGDSSSCIIISLDEGSSLVADSWESPSGPGHCVLLCTFWLSPLPQSRPLPVNFPLLLPFCGCGIRRNIIPLAGDLLPSSIYLSFSLSPMSYLRKERIVLACYQTRHQQYPGREGYQVQLPSGSLLSSVPIWQPVRWDCLWLLEHEYTPCWQPSRLAH